MKKNKRQKSKIKPIKRIKPIKSIKYKKHLNKIKKNRQKKQSKQRKSNIFLYAFASIVSIILSCLVVTRLLDKGDSSVYIDKIEESSGDCSPEIVEQSELKEV